MNGIVYDNNLRILHIIDDPIKDGNRIKGSDKIVYIGSALRYAKVDHIDLLEGDTLPAALLPAPEDVDKDTEAVINAAMHNTAPIGEQIGILRDQITHILNELGIDSTEDFARLNDVATAAIEAAQAKKEVLSEDDTTA